MSGERYNMRSVLSFQKQKPHQPTSTCVCAGAAGDRYCVELAYYFKFAMADSPFVS